MQGPAAKFAHKKAILDQKDGFYRPNSGLLRRRQSTSNACRCSYDIYLTHIVAHNYKKCYNHFAVHLSAEGRVVHAIFTFVA